MKFLKYRRRCDTEEVYVYSDYRTVEQGAPSACPNDPNHTLDPDDAWVTVEAYDQAVPIGPESGRVLTAGGQHSYGYHVHMKGHRIEVPIGTTPGAPYKNYFRFEKGDPLVPYLVELYSGSMRISGALDGDKLAVDMVAKDALGPGVDYVAASFLQDFYPDGTVVGAYEKHEFTPPDDAKLLPAGIYLRTTYTPGAVLTAAVVIKALVVAFKDPAV